MKIKEQLLREIESSSEELLLETLDFLQFLKTKNTNKVQSKPLIESTGKSLLDHLETLDQWSGEDIEDCLNTVKETRMLARFDPVNPFDQE